MPRRSDMADRVRALDDGTRTPREIAAILGCHPAYTRAVRSRDRVGWARNEGTAGGGHHKRHTTALYTETWAERKRRRQIEKARQENHP